MTFQIETSTRAGKGTISYPVTGFFVVVVDVVVAHDG